jgi:transposase
MVDADREALLAEKFGRLLPHLNERQKRLMVAAEARSIGRGGISMASRASGLSRPTLYKAIEELDGEVFESTRQRHAGAGRKRAVDHDPALVEILETLIEGGSRGDPRSPLRWTTKSTRRLANELSRKGHPVSSKLVSELLHESGYSLQSNTKVIEGKQHVDRDGQFRYINNKIRLFERTHDPVISVDSKKKELIGKYKIPGQKWEPEGEPTEVKTHDFKDKELGKIIPYGIYDIEADQGWIEVGIDHDTATFAVQGIRAWWHQDGITCHPNAKRLLVTADAGGSNSYRSRLWKKRSPISPTRSAWQLPCATFRPEPANGTRSNTGFSARYP